MSRMFNAKITIVMGVVVFILLLMQIESFADEDWKLITHIPTPRMDFATVVVDNKVYLIGGTLSKNVNGPLGISTAEVYDAQTNTWQRLTDMPTPRTIARAAVVNGILYVFGGFSSKDRFFQNWTLPVIVEAYNPATDTWIPKKDMPVSRINFDVGVVAGKVYLIGGTTGFGEGHEERMDRVDVYDPATDTWAKGPKMPTRREPMGVAVVSNRIYVIGGYGWPKAGPILTVIEEYDPISRQWRKKSDMLDVRYAFSTAVVDDDIYLIGGLEGFPNYVATVNVYNPQKDAWRDIPKLPMPLAPFRAATVDGKIYVFGGYGKGPQFFPDVLVFDTGFRAVEANGKLHTRWGELKGERKSQPRD